MNTASLAMKTSATKALFQTDWSNSKKRKSGRKQKPKDGGKNFRHPLSKVSSDEPHNARFDSSGGLRRRPLQTPLLHGFPSRISRRMAVRNSIILDTHAYWTSINQRALGVMLKTSSITSCISITLPPEQKYEA